MTLNFDPNTGLLPAVVQHATTRDVLMLGYVNQASLERTRTTGLMTFFSRSKNRLWTKGETSGNTLRVVSITPDCDADTLLVEALPAGPSCHTGSDTCFGAATGRFLYQLEDVVAERSNAGPDDSYTALLRSKGIAKVAQKVGEEAVETVIEALQSNREKFLEESADLLYHYLVLAAEMGVQLKDVEAVLKARHAG